MQPPYSNEPSPFYNQPTQSGFYPPPPPPNAGQFYYPPPPPPPSPRRYSNRILYTLLVGYILGWIIAFVGGASQGSVIESLGSSMIVGTLVSILIMDWSGFVSLNGIVQWRKIKGGGKFLLILVFLSLSPLLLGVYLVRTFLLYRQPVAQIPSNPVKPSCRPRIGLAVGTVVTLFVFVVAAAVSTPVDGTTTLSSASLSSTPRSSQTMPVTVSTKATQVVFHPSPTPNATPAQATATPVVQTIMPTPMPSPTPTPQPTQPPPTPTPQPTQPPPPTPTPVPPAQLSLTFTAASAVDYASGTVSVHTQPGVALTIVVTYCSGYTAKSASLQGTFYADGNGNYTWSWTPQTKCQGPATADVTASLNGQSVEQVDNFTVQ